MIVVEGHEKTRFGSASLPVNNWHRATFCIRLGADAVMIIEEYKYLKTMILRSFIIDRCRKRNFVEKEKIQASAWNHSRSHSIHEYSNYRIN